MYLLNSKSILDCNICEEELHSQEVECFLHNILTKNNYECAILKKYQDEGHAKLETEIISCKLHDLMEIIELCDIKNGMDVYMDDGFYIFVIYGQQYQLKEKNIW